MDENTRPIDIFSLIFTDELIDRLVEWTNSNYAQKKRLQPEKHRMKWTDTYLDEIRAFLAALIIMNDMIIVLRFERYFTSKDSKWYLQIPGIPTIFTRDRFKQLKRYLHFCDPNVPVLAVNDPAFDRLHKIRQVVSMLQEKFETLYYPRKEISIDGSMIPFKERLKFKQRMPLKPVKVGIKMFALSESQSGYCHKFQVYLSKDDDEADGGELGKTGLVVVRLLDGLQHKGFNVYVDNFYTSVPLFHHLSNHGISACGIIRTNRKYFPIKMLLPAAPGLNQGEFVWAAYKSMIALTWKDRKPVSFISTIHDPHLGNSYQTSKSWRSLLRNGDKLSFTR